MTKRDHTRVFLDNWRFWMGVAYVAIAVVIVFLWINYQDVADSQARQARDEAVKIASVQAQASATYQSCLNAIPELEKINTHVQGVNEFARTILVNSHQTLIATPKDDPQYAVRFANYERLLAATTKIGAARSIPVPTKQDCKDRRKAVIAQNS